MKQTLLLLILFETAVLSAKMSTTRFLVVILGCFLLQTRFQYKRKSKAFAAQILQVLFKLLALQAHESYVLNLTNSIFLNF